MYSQTLTRTAFSALVRMITSSAEAKAALPVVSRQLGGNCTDRTDIARRVCIDEDHNAVRCQQTSLACVSLSLPTNTNATVSTFHQQFSSFTIQMLCKSHHFNSFKHTKVNASTNTGSSRHRHRH